MVSVRGMQAAGEEGRIASVRSLGADIINKASSVDSMANAAIARIEEREAGLERGRRRLDTEARELQRAREDMWRTAATTIGVGHHP